MTNKLQKLFFLLLFSLGFSQLNAASFEVEKYDKDVNFSYNEEDAEKRSSNIYMKTSSLTAITIAATCIPVDMPAGVTYSLCTPTNCLPGKTGQFTFPSFEIDVNSNDFSRKMHLEADISEMDEALIPEGGLNFKVNVSVANVDNPSDKVDFVVTFIVNRNSGVFEQWTSVSSVSPNPAVEYVNINLNQESLNDNVIRVYNELGVEVMSKAFNGKNVSFETNALNNGRYFFKVENASKVINSGNFVVAR